MSSKRLVSGIGMVLSYRARCGRARVEPQDLNTVRIMERGLHRLCPVCEVTLVAFCQMVFMAASGG